MGPEMREKIKIKEVEALTKIEKPDCTACKYGSVCKEPG